MSFPTLTHRPRAAVVLDDLFPRNTLFVTRVSWRWNRWSIPDPPYRDFLTAAPLPLAGSLPVLVCRAAASPRIYRTLGRLLPPVPPGARFYDGEAGFFAELARARHKGERLAMAYPYAPEEVDEEAYAVPRSLLTRLNDKSLLHELVEDRFVPRRFRCTPPEIEARASLPCVIKAVDLEQVGGGYGLRFCDTVRDLVAATRFFEGVPAVVVEERLDLVRSDCVHFAIGPDGTPRYFGSTPQLIGENGQYFGNTVGLDAPHREGIEAARRAMQRAADLGYRGLAAFDIGILPDGTARLLDPNFRLNASSPVAAIWPSLDLDGGVLFTTFRFSGDVEAFSRAVLQANGDHGLIPLSTFDPELGGWRVRPFLVRALLPGKDRAEIEARKSALAASGLVSSVPPPPPER